MMNDTGGMGMKKHGRSGKPPKSPKFRHKMKMEAEKNERKPQQYTYFQSIADLLQARRNG